MSVPVNRDSNPGDLAGNIIQGDHITGRSSSAEKSFCITIFKQISNVQKLRQAPKRAARRIGRIAEHRHTAIAIYANGMGYLKALDAGEK
jgi:hypothetical protein